MAQTLAGDPSKEVNAQVYTFPPGAVLRWHIHPDAYEIAYVLEGTFTFEREGRRQKRWRQARPTISRPMSSIAA